MATDSIVQLPKVLRADPRLLINGAKQLVIDKGATRFTTQRQTASSLSNNQLAYNVVLANSEKVLIDSYMYTETVVQVTVGATGLTGSQTVQNYLNNNFAPRQYPFNSVTAVAQVTINSVTVSSNPAQFCHYLSQFQDFSGGSEQSKVQSIVPIMPDQTQQYSQAAGSLKSPLLDYFGGSQYEEPRGAYNSNFVTQTSGTGTWQFLVTIREPILSPVLEYNPNAIRQGIPYVTLLNIQLNMTANLNRMFSLDLVTCPNITSVNCNLLSSQLVMTWLTVPQNIIMPPLAIRSFNTIIVNQTLTSVSVNPGQQVTLQSQAYSPPLLPRKIWLYVINGNYDAPFPAGVTQTDTAFSIQTVNVLFNNQQGTLSTSLVADLYQLGHAEEGGKISFSAAQNYIGSVLQLDTVKSFGLEESLTSGMKGPFNLQIQVQCTNIAPFAITPVMFVVYGLDTIMTTDASSGNTNLIQGVISKEMVLQAYSLPATPFDFSDNNNFYGGSFIDTIKDYGRKAHDFVKNNQLVSRGLSLVGKVAPQFASVALPASALAASYGYGGKKMSKREMQRQMQMMAPGMLAM